MTYRSEEFRFGRSRGANEGLSHSVLVPVEGTPERQTGESPAGKTRNPQVGEGKTITVLAELGAPREVRHERRF